MCSNPSDKVITSSWYPCRSSSMRRLMAAIKVGDLLEFDRGEYKHWAVYVGNHENIRGPAVVHLVVMNRAAACAYTSLTSVNTSKGVRRDILSDIDPSEEKAAVQLESLASVMGNSKVRINNTKDEEWTPFAPQVVVSRALSKINARVNYFDVLNYNCEHFVNDCRYGRNVSFQVNSTLETVSFAFSSLRQLFPLIRRFLNNSNFN